MRHQYNNYQNHRQHHHNPRGHQQQHNQHPPDHQNNDLSHRDIPLQPVEYPNHPLHQQHHQAQLQRQFHNYHASVTPSLVIPPPLPQGWVEATDPSTGKIYYANPETRETQWERPIINLAPQTAAVSVPALASVPAWNVPVRVPASAAQSYDGIQTDRTTGRSTGEGNLLYTAGGSATTNVAMTQPEKLVIVARQMLEKVQAFPDRTMASDLELHSLTCGQIASLCQLQHRLYQQAQLEQQQRKKQQGLGRNDNQRSYDNAQNVGTFPDDNDDEYKPLPPYTPINPFTMPPSASALLLERTEPGRLDVRMHSLREELKAFGYQDTQH